MPRRIWKLTLTLLTGEAGIGKSRLASELAAQARQAGSRVLVGHSVPRGDAYRPLAEALAGGLRGRPVPSDPALRPYLSALGNLLPELSADQPAGGGRIVLGEAVLRLMAAMSGSAGTVLVLEDVHWADPDTLDIVTYLSHAAEATPLLVLLTARDEPDTPPQVLELGRGYGDERHTEEPGRGHLAERSEPAVKIGAEERRQPRPGGGRRTPPGSARRATPRRSS